MMELLSHLLFCLVLLLCFNEAFMYCFVRSAWGCVYKYIQYICILTSAWMEVF